MQNFSLFFSVCPESLLGLMFSLKKLDFACACMCVCVCVCVCVHAHVYVCINVTNQNLHRYNSKSYNCHMYKTISRIDEVSKVHKLKI